MQYFADVDVRKVIWFQEIMVHVPKYIVFWILCEGVLLRGILKNVASIFVSLHPKKLSKWNTALIIAQIVYFVCVPHAAPTVHCSAASA